MLSGNGTIEYDAEAHTLDARKTSAARQESTTGNLHGSTATTFHGGTDGFRVGKQDWSMETSHLVVQRKHLQY